MPFRKLLATSRGQSLLVNCYDMLMDSIPPPRERVEIFGNLRSILESLPRTHEDDELVAALGAWVFANAALVHGAGPDAPIEHKHLAAVLSFDHVKRLLRAPLRTNKTDPRVREHLRAVLDCPDPPSGTLHEAAALVEALAPENPMMILGRDNNIFWATTTEAIKETRGLGGGPAAERLRDRLGLSRPDPRKEEPPVHLFLFECKKTLGALRDLMTVACTRPTVIEGFDNTRFCHRAPACANGVLGCGRTVDLFDGGFGPGAPEVVLSGVPLGKDFCCTYLGSVVRPPSGADDAFIEFIRAERDLSDMVAMLEAASAPVLV